MFVNVARMEEAESLCILESKAAVFITTQHSTTSVGFRVDEIPLVEQLLSKLRELQQQEKDKEDGNQEASE